MRENIESYRGDPYVLSEPLYTQLTEYVELSRLDDECRQELWQFFGLPGSYETPLTKEQRDEIKVKVEADLVLNSLNPAQMMGVDANGG